MWPERLGQRALEATQQVVAEVALACASPYKAETGKVADTVEENTLQMAVLRTASWEECPYKVRLYKAS